MRFCGIIWVTVFHSFHTLLSLSISLYFIFPYLKGKVFLMWIHDHIAVWKDIWRFKFVFWIIAHSKFHFPLVQQERFIFLVFWVLFLILVLLGMLSFTLHRFLCFCITCLTSSDGFWNFVRFHSSYWCSSCNDFCSIYANWEPYL